MITAKLPRPERPKNGSRKSQIETRKKVSRVARRYAFFAFLRRFWPWSSAYPRVHGNKKQKKLLSAWPMAEPGNDPQWLNESQGKEEIENIRHDVTPFPPESLTHKDVIIKSDPMVDHERLEVF
jgi:hypothetical protein